MKSSETGTRAKLVHLNLPMNSPLYFLHYLPPNQEPCLREGNLSACLILDTEDDGIMVYLPLISRLYQRTMRHGRL